MWKRNIAVLIAGGLLGAQANLAGAGDSPSQLLPAQARYLDERVAGIPSGRGGLDSRGRFHLAQLGLPSLSHRLAQHREPALARLPAAMREAKEVKGLRLALAPRPPALRREAAKADEARLVRMQF